jgi:hypothetical protein
MIYLKLKINIFKMNNCPISLIRNCHFMALVGEKEIKWRVLTSLVKKFDVGDA